jgi:hypothetical protein
VISAGGISLCLSTGAVYRCFKGKDEVAGSAQCASSATPRCRRSRTATKARPSTTSSDDSMDGPCQATALGTLIAAVRPGQTAARVSLTAPTRVTRRLYPVHAVLGACFDVVLATWPLRRVPSWDRTVARFVAFLRAVNLGERRVATATARGVLEELGYDQVGSYANSGNLLFSATGNAPDHEAAIRSALEEVFGFELTTFVRTARQVNALGHRQAVRRHRPRPHAFRAAPPDLAHGHGEEGGRGALERPRRGRGSGSRRALAHPLEVTPRRR